MYKKSKMLLLSLVLFSVTGCGVSRAVNKTLSPPVDTKWVNIELKNPSPYTKPFPLEVRYISYKCKKKRISGFDGSVITEHSYNVIGIPMRQESADVWKAKVATIGGGSCSWTLSAINLGIEYIDAIHLGKNLVPGAAVGVTLAFDNDASRNGQYTLVHGDLILSPKYYAYIREWRLVRNKNELTILGKEDFLLYHLVDAKNIIFKPLLDEKKIIRYVEPEKKVKGIYPKIIYPDGGIISDGTVFPDFDKLDKMKVK